MQNQTEIERIKQDLLDENLPLAHWSFEVDLKDRHSDTWNKIRNVIEAIASYDYDEWPADEYWIKSFPNWLVSFMMTEEQTRIALAKTPREQWDNLPWDFRSWLDAIRERDWRWWGGEKLGSSAHIVLQVTGVPPRIDAFKQILLAAGADILSEHYN